MGHRRPSRRGVLLALVLAVVVVVGNLAANPWFARERSLLVMQGYDWYHERSALPRTAGVDVRLPLARSGLYPLLLTYNADAAMSRRLGADVRFTVDYTFADFPAFAARSTIYDPDAELYSAYVGSYQLQGLGRPLTAAEVAEVAEFDQRALALPALGLGFADNRFELTPTGESTSRFAGIDWTRHDASVLTNCPDHRPAGFLPAYLQFGTPPATDQHYPLCELQAQIEVSYLAEQDLTIGLYVLAASEAARARLSTEVVQRAEVIVSG